MGARKMGALITDAVEMKSVSVRTSLDAMWGCTIRRCTLRSLLSTKYGSFRVWAGDRHHVLYCLPVTATRARALSRHSLGGEHVCQGPIGTLEITTWTSPVNE